MNQFQSVTHKLEAAIKGEEAADIAMAQNRDSGLSANAVKQQSKAITRKLHKKIASAKKLSAKLLAACNKREQGMKEAEAQYAAVVRRFNQNQLQKTSGAAAADMAVAMAKQNTVKLQLVKKSMETEHCK